MIILEQNLDEPIYIIPNVIIQYPLSVLVFEYTNETTKTVHTKSADSVFYQNDLLVATVITSDFLQENTFYNLKVYNSFALEQTFYKDKVFCTNQPKSSYSINSGQYTTPNIDNNSYITI